MAYNATWINRRDLPGGTTEVEVILNDPAGQRPSVRLMQSYPTASVTVALRNSEAARLIAATVAAQNAFVAAQSRSDTAQATIDAIVTLRASTRTLLDTYADRIADSLATAPSTAWDAAHAAAVDVFQSQFPSMVRAALQAARDVS